MRPARRAAAVLAAAAACAAPAAACDFDVTKAEAWLRKEGCTNGTINSCPGGLTPAQGCSDAVYIARVLAAGGAVPAMDPDDGHQWSWTFYKYQNETYHLDTSDGLREFLVASGWRPTRDAAERAPAGAVVFTSAWGGEPCFAHGGDRFFCHSPPLLHATNCDVTTQAWECCPTQSVWSCAAGPPPPMPPTPDPTPAPPVTPAPPPLPPPAPGACKGSGWYLESLVCKDAACTAECETTRFESGACQACGDACSFRWCCPIDGSAPVLTSWPQDGTCGGGGSSAAHAAGVCTPTPPPYPGGTLYRCVTGAPAPPAPTPAPAPPGPVPTPTPAPAPTPTPAPAPTPPGPAPAGTCPNGPCKVDADCDQTGHCNSCVAVDYSGSGLHCRAGCGDACSADAECAAPFCTRCAGGKCVYAGA